MNSENRFFWRFWWSALAVKTVVAIWLPFANDEAYYWVWGHHPQLSYFDHPGMVGWLFSIGTLLESFGNAARLPGVVLGHFTLLIWWHILRPHFESSRLRFWLMLASLSPFLGLGSLIQTPDVPMLFFWSLSLLIFLQLINKPKPTSYLALGASLGLGFCSKYLIVLFVPCALIWLLASGEWRRVRWTYVPLTIMMGLLACGPVLYWNGTHNWASFAFQLQHGLVSAQQNWAWPFEYASGQIAILFPPVAWYAARRKTPPGLRFLVYFGWLPLAFFLYSSVHARVEANWPIAGHPALIALAVANAPNLKWLRATGAIWLTVSVIALSQVLVPWIPLNSKQLKTSEFTRFDVFLPAASTANEIYFGSYQMASSVSYKLKRQFYKVEGMNRRDFYDFQPQSHPNSDRFLIGAEKNQSLPEWMIHDGYQIDSARSLNDEYQILEVSRRAQNTDR